MRAGPRAVVAAAVVAFAVAWANVGPAAAAPASPLGHHGRWITDAHGRVVIVHGFNVVNKLPPYHPAAVGFGDDDAEFLRRHGFNTVRLGIIHKALEPQPGQYDEAYLGQIGQTYEVLRRRGILVLLDFHQDMFNERFNGEGEPDWAVLGDAATLPPQPDVGFPGNYLVMPALWRAYDHFWANEGGPGGVGVQDRFAAAWRRVAERFADEGSLLGYNLFNEPFPGSPWPTCATPQGCPSFDRERLEPFHERVIEQIRRADAESLVWYAPLLFFDFGADTSHGDTGDERAGFAFNHYCLAQPAGAAGLPLPALQQGCDAESRFGFDNAEEQSRQTGDALLMTEFGAVDDLAEIERVAELADRRMIGWQQWTYWGADPCCERPEEGLIIDPHKPPTPDNVKQGKLDVSERAYPQAVAGTPTGYFFDRRELAFELAYETTLPAGGQPAPGLQTEVYVPPRHFPEGYRAHVSGALVVSPPGAPVLRLVRCAGADRVALRVTPGSGVAADGCRGERLQLSVAPRRSVEDRRRRYTFRATAGGRPVRGATVRFAGARATTDAAGRAAIRRRLTRPGRYRAKATRAGLQPGRTAVRVLGRPAPRFTG